MWYVNDKRHRKNTEVRVIKGVRMMWDGLGLECCILNEEDQRMWALEKSIFEVKNSIVNCGSGYGR